MISKKQGEFYGIMTDIGFSVSLTSLISLICSFFVLDFPIAWILIFIIFVVFFCIWIYYLKKWNAYARQENERNY